MDEAAKLGSEKKDQSTQTRTERMDSSKVLRSQWRKHSLRHNRLEKEKSLQERAAVQVTEKKRLNTELISYASVTNYHPFSLYFGSRGLAAQSVPPADGENRSATAQGCA